MKRCVIIGAGEVSDLALLAKQIRPEDEIIAVDNGLAYAKKLGITPQFIIGDFDSYQGEIPEGDNVFRFQSEKDDTDTMLALKMAIEQGFGEILFAGMLGGRLDHTFANIQAVTYAAKRGVHLQIWDSEATVHAVHCGSITIPPITGHMVGVFAVSDVCHGVDIVGAKYPLQGATLTNDFPIGVSNEFVGENPIQVTVSDGTLVIITSKQN